MCRVFKLHRSGFYALLNKPLSDKAIEGSHLIKLKKSSTSIVAASMKVIRYIENYAIRIGNATLTVWPR